MKLYLLVPLIGAAFLGVCIGVVFFVGQREPVEEEDVAAVADVTPTPSPEETAVFTEEGRQASVPANAETTAPNCDRGAADRLADETAMAEGTIEAYTKETIIQVVLRRNELFSTASAGCIRTYLRTSNADTTAAWAGFETMSDQQLLQAARASAQQSAGLAEQMRAPEAVWTYGGSRMTISVTKHTATFVNGYWY